MRAAAWALLFVLATLAGCGSPQHFELTDVTGADFGTSLELNDHHGQPRRLQDFRGKVVVLFFGFTHCPDVCPTTLADLAMAMKGLGEDAKRVQVLFVTVDPERDTPGVLAKYVPAFYPTFLGMYGDAAATARAAKSFKVFYQKQPLPGGSYTMDHAAGTYILDTEGRLRLFAQYGAGPRAFVHDIKVLLDE